MENEWLKLVLQKMLLAVGVEEWPGDKWFTKTDWYLQHSWTLEQQNEFEYWMTEMLFNNVAARKSLCAMPVRDKKHLRKAANEFTFCYGWKLK